MSKNNKIILNEYRIIKGNNIDLKIYEISKHIIKRDLDVFHLKYKVSKEDEEIKIFGEDFIKKIRNYAI